MAHFSKNGEILPEIQGNEGIRTALRGDQREQTCSPRLLSLLLRGEFEGVLNSNRELLARKWSVQVLLRVEDARFVVQ